MASSSSDKNLIAPSNKRKTTFIKNKVRDRESVGILTIDIDQENVQKNFKDLKLETETMLQSHPSSISSISIASMANKDQSPLKYYVSSSSNYDLDYGQFLTMDECITSFEADDDDDEDERFTDNEDGDDEDERFTDNEDLKSIDTVGIFTIDL